MPGTAGPRLGLVWGYAPGEVGWGVGGFNPNFAKLEALVHLTVIAVAATPPTTPANGDCYIVAASPTGAWVGHADDIAVYYTTGGWLYIDPAVGIRAFDRSGDGYIRFDGVDWVDEIVPAADVSGPAGAVDGNIAVLDVTGKVIRDGGQALPTGLIVGTTDIQILEHKVIDGADNSLVIHLDSDVVGNLPIVNLGGGVGASNTTVFYGDGTWRAPGGGGGGGASITVSDTPPASPAVGQMWFDSTTACLFVWYVDSSGGQWVVAVNVGSGGGGVLSISATGPLAASAPDGNVTLSLSTVPIGLGGTGSTSAPAALTALGAFPAAGGTIAGNTSINGGLTINSPGGAAIQITVPAGVLAQTIMSVTGGRTWVNYVSYSDGTYAIYDGTAAAARLTIDAAGACFNTSGSWSAISARELKESVEPYTRGLEAVLALEPVSFRYAPGTPFAREAEPSDPVVGLLADQVEPHIPEMCGTTTITLRDELREVQTLNPGDLTYVLINAIKELEARVRELEARPPNPPEALPA